MSEGDLSIPALAAVVASVYAVGGLAAAVLRHRSLATVGAVTTLVWCAVFVG